MASGEEHVYATLLLSDSYLPGALVLAHSLRDAGTTKKLVVLVTLDTVSAESITQLKTVYDHVLPVPRICNEKPANLYLMNRADLHSAFTKINLWKQTQFSKVVYIDADVVAYRAPDELFDIAEPFAAAPDIGWPDLFNSGVMVLTPNLGDFYAMLAMAERGISFDGADQGLLNMHFKDNYHRLSFAYNVTPSAHYQYIPAYRHFQSSINMVHFIGPNKPWFAGRHAKHDDSPFDDMIGRWWAVYDRHYRAQHSMIRFIFNIAVQEQSSGQPQGSSSTYVQYFTKGEFRPKPTLMQQPPPADSAPEAINFPSTHYEMSQDAAPFVPPPRYPSPPKNMWYEVPTAPPAPPAELPKPVFPWEGQQPKPTRTFASVVPDFVTTPQDTGPWVEHGVGGSVESGLHVESHPPEGDSTETGTEAGSSVATLPSQLTPTEASTVQAEPWDAFQLSNAWDEVPEINRYVEGLQKHKRGKSLQGISSPATTGPRYRRDPNKSVFKLTDFPSAFERPSLPVTPAPIARPSFWGQEQPDARELELSLPLPSAEGVPMQSDWDPEVQLQKLARQQYEALLLKLEASANVDNVVKDLGHSIPKRSLPFGSESIRSPSFISQNVPVSTLQRAVQSTSRADSTFQLTLPHDAPRGTPKEVPRQHGGLLESPMAKPRSKAPE
ncbi:unnamed protein product [Clonostachys rhizophaga]|uniref:glycogenin glucosyltransferase n=1 Tax=Clonostachys rhizophaga TaxID=160324 RepID=A0A9N9YHP9_9HYPO|nr:unnamed protein product [Clonostachys rhizophaga]